MTEYVKKSEVLDTLWKADGITYHGIEVLNHMPAEDVEEVKRGQWIDKGFCSDEGVPHHVAECSICGYGHGNRYWKFCPNCGARMEASDGR